MPKNDASLLVRLPEVEALLDYAVQLDETWDNGALHEFSITWAAARRGARNHEALAAHYARALELSAGHRASLFVAYAEAQALRTQKNLKNRLSES